MRTFLSEDKSQGCISYQMSDPTLKEQATKTFLNAKKLLGNIAERVQYQACLKLQVGPFGMGRIYSRRLQKMANYGKAASRSVKSAMHREKSGTLKSGKGGKGGAVKSKKQAIAIGLSEARKKGTKVPKKKSS
jgi:hypothetical protein